MSIFCRDCGEARELASSLKEFYCTTGDYVAFHAPSNQVALWHHVVLAIRRMLPDSRDSKLRVLEVGAGRSGLAEYLDREGLRRHLELHAQDVTASNIDWIGEHFDGVTVGGICDVPGDFEIIIGSYVFEHVSDPRDFLGQLMGKLRPGGSLFMACPRYDLPFYLSRSADHFTSVQRAATGAYVLLCRLLTLATGKPAWLVHKDPAVFHLPFFRDRDAVHWVSWFDVRAHWPHAMRLKLASGSVRDWVAKNLLTIGFRVEKEAGCVPHADNRRPISR